MEDDLDITGLSKAEVLAALYNNSRQLGLGMMHPRGAVGMNVAQAQDEIDAKPTILFGSRRGEKAMYFDYLHGRVMKVDLAGDTLNPRLYDRDNGHGSAQKVIEMLRGEKRKAG